MSEVLVGNLRKTAVTLSLSLGGLDLRSAVRTSVPVHWASWADVQPMIRDRHPTVATMILNALEDDTVSPCLGAASRAAQDLDGMEDFDHGEVDFSYTSEPHIAFCSIFVHTLTRNTP